MSALEYAPEVTRRRGEKPVSHTLRITVLRIFSAAIAIVSLIGLGRPLYVAVRLARSERAVRVAPWLDPVTPLLPRSAQRLVYLPAQRQLERVWSRHYLAQHRLAPRLLHTHVVDIETLAKPVYVIIDADSRSRALELLKRCRLRVLGDFGGVILGVREG